MGAFLDSEVVLRYVDGRRTLCRSMSLRPRGEMFWSRRRRRRGGCLAETRSGRVLDVSHIFDLSSVRVESLLSRVLRVTAALHGHHNACGTYFTEFMQRA